MNADICMNANVLIAIVTHAAITSSKVGLGLPVLVHCRSIFRLCDPTFVELIRYSECILKLCF